MKLDFVELIRDEIEDETIPGLMMEALGIKPNGVIGILKGDDVHEVVWGINCAIAIGHDEQYLVFWETSQPHIERLMYYIGAEREFSIEAKFDELTVISGVSESRCLRWVKSEAETCQD